MSHCPGGYFISYSEAEYITCGLSFIVSHCPGGYFISYSEAEYITCGLSFIVSHCLAISYLIVRLGI